MRNPASALTEAGFGGGHLRILPHEYKGERHIVTVGRHPNGEYDWDERPRPRPAPQADDSHLIRIILVTGKDGRPVESFVDAAVWPGLTR